VRLKRLTALSAVLLAAAPGWAMAAPTIYSQVLAAYQANGSIPPCQFTSADLQQALKGVDTYGQQYFADFTNAIQTALAARGSGACLPGGPRAPSGHESVAAAQFVPPSITGSTSAGLPAPLLVLAGLSVAFAAGGLLTVLGRARGWDPRWAASLRHGLGEAGYRAGDAWERFLGRGRSRP
jgi:hypothetical protein